MTDWPSRFAAVLAAYDRRQRLRRVVRRDMAAARKAGLVARHRQRLENAGKDVTKGRT